jgi:hypothetical protein
MKDAAEDWVSRIGTPDSTCRLQPSDITIHPPVAA